KRDSGNSASMRFDMGLELQSGKVYIGNPAHLTFDFAAPRTTWTHLAIVATATNTLLYVNGNLQQTLGVFTLGTRANANTAIGGTGEPLSGDDDPFKGAIDEVRAYNRALSSSEIQLAFNTTPPVISGVGA